jgi:hypothetical protein
LHKTRSWFIDFLDQVSEALPIADAPYSVLSRQVNDKLTELAHVRVSERAPVVTSSNTHKQRPFRLLSKPYSLKPGSMIFAGQNVLRHLFQCLKFSSRSGDPSIPVNQSAS